MKTSPFVFALIASAACAGSQPSPVASPVNLPPAQAVPVPESEPGPAETQSNVAISDDIRRACGISESEAFFAYDSSRVAESAGQLLKKLADCFVTGPLKGRTMRLVGHADPRGDGGYNYLLGQRRADSVRGVLIDLGAPASGITTTSRGEDDASGSDERGWARDRRVDITLGS